MTDVQRETSPAAPAPGWYPDPAAAGSSRWWSGTAWTDHVQPAAVATVPEPVVPALVAAPTVAPVTVEPAVASSNLDARGVPVTLFADHVFDPAVLTPPPPGPSTQSDWHTVGGRTGATRRQPAGSVSLSTQAPSAAARRHDPYRERNWVAELALALAVLSAPALVLRLAWDLPALTQGIFGGAPIAIGLLALASAIRKGSGIVLSIVAIVIAGLVLLAGFVVDPAILTGIADTVTGWLPQEQ